MNSTFKLLLAGKGLSFRTGKYLGEAMLVGVVTGFVVVGFKWLIGFGDAALALCGVRLGSEGALPDVGVLAARFSIDSLKSPIRIAVLFLPMVGAVLGYLLICRIGRLSYARGTDSAIRAYHQNDGYVTTTVIPVKSIASVLTVACGGSAGYEGPVTLIGAACGSMVARIMHLTLRARRILMASGLAAGIGALFQAPLAGALFGFEIFYSSSDVEYETLLPSFIASAVSYTIFAYFYGWGSLFTMPQACAYDSGLRLMPYFLLAIVIAFGARFYISIFRSVETWLGKVEMNGIVKVAIGGLLTGLIGFVFPEVLGTGYGIIRSGLDAQCIRATSGCAVMLFAIFLLKAVATSFTVGSGGSGGVFAPALVCGAALGGSVGIFFRHVLPASFGINPASFVLVGMAGFLASSVRIPMTSIVIVSEISGNHGLMLPAMWVCGIAFWLNNGWSLYRSQPHSRESSPVHLGDD